MVRREPQWKAIDWLSLLIGSGVILLTFVIKLGGAVEQGPAIAAVLSFLGLS